MAADMKSPSQAAQDPNGSQDEPPGSSTVGETVVPDVRDDADYHEVEPTAPRRKSVSAGQTNDYEEDYIKPIASSRKSVSAGQKTDYEDYCIEPLAPRRKSVSEGQTSSGALQLREDAWLMGTDKLQAANDKGTGSPEYRRQPLDDSITGCQRKPAGGAAAAAASLSDWWPWGGSSNSENAEAPPSDEVSEGSMRYVSSGGAASAWLPWLDRSGKPGSNQASGAASTEASQTGSKQVSRTGSKAPIEAPSESKGVVPAPENAPDCPICFEPISAGEAAMRCTGGAGVQHCFHRCCLSAWIKTSISTKSPPTCPVCRGAVQVNVAQLESYLASGEADHLLGPDRNVLENLLARAKATLGTSSTQDGWAEPFTAEDALNASVLGLALSAGFMAGFSDEIVDDLLVLTASELSTSPAVQIASSIGYVAGVTSHFASEVF
eukprot:TRINITY_DN58312_c0_g1_i1.p1 TRINITY_DN58312_c0_g1~~TRINITY_DN58312_c0_g1_i1.p1  ORF type:complete len:436 (+),score=70.95 TRINITY_DN58312_c0_g1_i1:81-1388(+)